MTKIIQRAVPFEKRERWKGRPEYKGFYIPYTNLIVDGVPNFQAVSVELNLECAAQQKCTICGESLITGEAEMWLAFIGGEVCLETREFIDPAMHPECAYYAAENCPYLKNEDSSYSKARNERAPEGSTMLHLREEDRVRPDKMIIYFAKGYQVRLDGAVLLVVAKKDPHVIDREAMP